METMNTAWESLGLDHLVMKDYLEKESSKAVPLKSKMRRYETDGVNQIMSSDILKESEKVNAEEFEAPLKVVDRYREMPSLA